MYLLDSHCDTPSQILRLRDLSIDNDHSHVDFPKLRKGGVDGAFFALYVPASLQEDDAYRYSYRLLDGVRAVVAANPDKAAFAVSHEQAMSNRRQDCFPYSWDLRTAVQSETAWKGLGSFMMQECVM